jgi:hypothetical protein
MYVYSGNVGLQGLHEFVLPFVRMSIFPRRREPAAYYKFAQRSDKSCSPKLIIASYDGSKSASSATLKLDLISSLRKK